MPHTLRVSRLAIFFLVLLLPALAFGAIENKWRVQCSGNAESSGQITLRIGPKNKAPIDVTISITNRLSENRVAKAIRDGLKEAIGEDFKLEVDDGEDVLIKRRFGRPRFSVEVIENSVKGVRLNLDQE